MRLIQLLLVIGIVPLLLTSCWGVKEIEHLAYVNSIGIDYVKGKVVFYTQMISFNNIAKKEAGAGMSKELVSIGKGEGRTVDEAIFDLYKTSQQRLSWSHVKTLAFTEAALREDVIHGILDQMDRYYEFRYTIWTMVTRGSIENIFNANPTQNMSTLYSQLNNPRDRYSQSSLVAPLYLYKFIWKWEENGQILLLPTLTVNENNWIENKKPSPQLQQDGVCAMQSKKLMGCFKIDEIMGLRWMEKETVRTPLILQIDQKPIAMMVVQKIKPSIEPKISNGKLTFHIKVKAQGSVTEQEKPTTEKELKELAAKEIRKQIQKTYLIGLKSDADLLGLSNSLYRSNPKEWHRLEKDGVLPLKPESLGEINVDIGISDVGIAKILKKND
ncbi:Ger(x)C family spore germination protein [Paenibacillus alginolyticus]|uniref:Ger(X)C family spore germination protein n=1 Tax=Paenibacillus alginolyticus TaxID=59839 RepID=A0ABT4GFI4_9BACL|nr:Ger(x)C family spore germination protein [Paenibacillus alginolyticus]MCY9694948.1 Ger(x)C family spore germination protein [Paenibacillus alginolyticus]MEC0143043.1 Ger(x)C family spore germination protein [Paenibacillus alginolyticus]